MGYVINSEVEPTYSLLHSIDQFFALLHLFLEFSHGFYPLIPFCIEFFDGHLIFHAPHRKPTFSSLSYRQPGNDIHSFHQLMTYFAPAKAYFSI